MSVREIHERLAAAFAAKDEEGVRAAAGRNIRFVMPGMETTGIDAYIEMARVWWNAFPDMEIRTSSVYVDGETVIEEGTFSGTHSGPMPTPTGDVVPPTGKRVELPYADLFLIRDGAVQEDRLYLDRMAMLEQLGLVPAGAAG
jgi:predicted ester cyclase